MTTSDGATNTHTPTGVTKQRNVLIPLADGVELACDLRLPEGIGPVPAIVTYIPYQKDAMFAADFDRENDFFAAHGYAVVVVDVRGLGCSGGLPDGVSDPREARDMTTVIAWIAEQPWCDGSVGMWGVSYGGITTFSTAAQRPPALKAIVAVQGCVDMYRDASFTGGLRNCLGVEGAWGPLMLALQLMPPTLPDEDGRWERIWRRRREEGVPIMLPWHDHETRDDYWEGRSTVVEDIETPAFLIGSWRDIFPEPMVRAYERLTSPKKLWMGPWLHGGPDKSPFEAVAYLDQMMRWWDRWLRNEDTGIENEPPVTIFVEQGDGWRNEAAWPIPRTTTSRYSLSPDGALTLGETAGSAWVRYQCDPTVGAQAGLWEPLALGLGLPLDQAEDDLKSLTFTTEPLAEELEITGDPRAVVRLRVVEGEDAAVVAKLVVLRPNGESALISTGMIRVSHRNGSEAPAPVPLGEDIEVTVPLWTISYRVRAGERLRLSISGADFPRYWPLPHNATIELRTGADGTYLDLPLVAGPTGVTGPEMVASDPTIDYFPLVVGGAPLWSIERDLATGSVAVTTGAKSDIYTPDLEGRVIMGHVATATVQRDRPDAARIEARTEAVYRSPVAQEIKVTALAFVTQHGMDLRGTIDVNGEQIYERSWHA